jgi:hypothetical protein
VKIYATWPWCRRSRPEGPPHMPAVSVSVLAYSRHSGRTVQVVQMRRPAAAVCPCDGKNIPSGNPAHAAFDIHLGRFRAPRAMEAAP